MLKDTDIFPWGKFKGVKMANVPASYLMYLKGEIEREAPNKRSATSSAILEYINDNLDVLAKENKNDKTN